MFFCISVSMGDSAGGLFAPPKGELTMPRPVGDPMGDGAGDVVPAVLVTDALERTDLAGRKSEAKGSRVLPGAGGCVCACGACCGASGAGSEPKMSFALGMCSFGAVVAGCWSWLSCCCCAFICSSCLCCS